MDFNSRCPIGKAGPPSALYCRWIGVLTAACFAIVAAACGQLQLPESQQQTPTADAPPAFPHEVRPQNAATPAPPAAIEARARTALLLPLSGPQRPFAEAVRDGFVAAYLENAGPRADIVVFDENLPGPGDAYRAAIDSGATMVIGPLLKESVAVVAPMVGSTPTLALNYLDTDVPASAAFFQFALAPEDEAQQVAKRALALGQRRALVLAPDNEWGRRMRAAFVPALETAGGMVLASRLYAPAQTDFTAELEKMLLLDESRARHRLLSANLHLRLEFEPRLRHDVDFIFLAANSAAGRLIRPQLRFLYAGDIPVYSTSSIYAAGTSGDPDLDGVMFTDAPVLIGADSRAVALRSALDKHWAADASARLRFYAMGYDAYALSGELSRGSFDAVPGLTGRLSMDVQRRIHRDLPWAAFREGRIVPLPDPLPGDAPVTSRAP